MFSVTLKPAFYGLGKLEFIKKELKAELFGNIFTETRLRVTRKKWTLHPFSFPPSLHAPYFLKVSVWEINDHSAAEDDSLHKDDIELISEMLQNWLFDVYC